MFMQYALLVIKLEFKYFEIQTCYGCILTYRQKPVFYHYFGTDIEVKRKRIIYFIVYCIFVMS
jgi:hypothetical protein